jgi:hypothetical protein
MPTSPMNRVIKHLRRTALLQDGAGQTDAAALGSCKWPGRRLRPAPHGTFGEAFPFGSRSSSIRALPLFPVPNVEERPVQRPTTRVNPDSLNRRNHLPSLITVAVLPGNDKRLAHVGPTLRGRCDQVDLESGDQKKFSFSCRFCSLSFDQRVVGRMSRPMCQRGFPMKEERT